MKIQYPNITMTTLVFTLWSILSHHIHHDGINYTITQHTAIGCIIMDDNGVWQHY